jgi:hypothetical protein
VNVTPGLEKVENFWCTGLMREKVGQVMVQITLGFIYQSKEM